MLGYFLLFFTTIISSFFISKSRSSLTVFNIVFILMMLLNLIVYLASMKMGLDGYSIFTKEILDDEIIYREYSLDVYNNLINKKDLINGNSSQLDSTSRINFSSLAKSEFYYSLLIALGYFVSGSKAF